jgi:small subunit ribosomal protein S5
VTVSQGRHAERDSEFEETVVTIRRCSAVVKGGRRFSFAALVVVGDGAGRVGIGYGKAKEVPPAVEKGVKDARKELRTVAVKGESIPHEVIGRYGTAKVFMKPAGRGTGVIAGASVRAVINAAGIKDILIKATINGLEQLRHVEETEKLRGVKL